MHNRLLGTARWFWRRPRKPVCGLTLTSGREGRGVGLDVTLAAGGRQWAQNRSGRHHAPE